MDNNKYSIYRKIRYDRTYRTLGKMSWWRIVLGVALLISVLFISGAVSDSFAARGNFRTAQKLIVWPWWMETYRPETKDYIDAGVLYQDGEYESAYAAFEALGDTEQARLFKSLSALRLAQEKNAAGDQYGAAEALSLVDSALLSGTELEAYETLLASLPGRAAA